MKRQCNNRLLIEVYKFEIGYSPEIMNDVFHLRHTYNLSNIYALATSFLEITTRSTPSFIGQINYGKP